MAAAHRRLVGLNLGDDVAGLDPLALSHKPLGELALLHSRRQRGHQDGRGHGALKRGKSDRFADRPRERPKQTKWER